jgi:hypothetical protein
MMRAIKEASKKYGWPDMVIGPFDEALDSQDWTRHVIDAMPLVHTLAPEARIYMTEWHNGYTRLYQSSGKTLTGRGRPKGKEYKALVKSGEQPIFNFHVIGANVMDPESRRIQDSFGGEYWNYGILHMGPGARFSQGFKTWIIKNEASLFWAGWKQSFDNPAGWTTHWPMPDDPAARKNNQGLYLASCKGAIGREAIDDRKYIETLRYYAKKKNSQEDLDWLDKEVPPRCKKLAGGFGEMGGRYNVALKIVNANGMQMLRNEIKERIMKLVK